jgi:hypothetical protein
LASTDVAELNIVWHASEKRDALPNQYRYPRDGKIVDLASTKEFLNRYPAIDIDVLGAAG